MARENHKDRAPSELPDPDRHILIDKQMNGVTEYRAPAVAIDRSLLKE